MLASGVLAIARRQPSRDATVPSLKGSGMMCGRTRKESHRDRLRAVFLFYLLLMSLNKMKGDITMSKKKKKKVTNADLQRLLPNSRLLPPDDPIYDEPPGILFTGGWSIKRDNNEEESSKRKEENDG